MTHYHWQIQREHLHCFLRLLRAGNEVEVVARCLLFLLEIHHGPIASSGNLEPVLAELDRSLRIKVGLSCIKPFTYHFVALGWWSV